MQIEMWQIILLSLLGFYAIVENLGICILVNQALMMGTITGLIMGDLTTGFTAYGVRDSSIWRCECTRLYDC